jgi:hypothetical protein
MGYEKEDMHGREAVCERERERGSYVASSPDIYEQRGKRHKDVPTLGGGRTGIEKRREEKRR